MNNYNQRYRVSPLVNRVFYPGGQQSASDFEVDRSNGIRGESNFARSSFQTVAKAYWTTHTTSIVRQCPCLRFIRLLRMSEWYQMKSPNSRGSSIASKKTSWLKVTWLLLCASTNFDEFSWRSQKMKMFFFIIKSIFRLLFSWHYISEIA